jgi:beta-galactosidase GanA
MILVALIIVLLGSMYGIARWYIASQENKPLKLGVTFIPDYAEYLGVDPGQTLAAILNNLGVKRLRLVSYWNDIEPAKGQYNFTKLDHEFQAANRHHAKVTLAIGLRQPRWPECHPPNGIDTKQPQQKWYPALQKYMTKTVNRYKNNPALVSYQLENEYFLRAFGECHNYSRQRLINEFHLVKKLDPRHPVIISASNSLFGGTSLRKPTPDKYAWAIYRKVYNDYLHHYFQYPTPAWYYAFWGGLNEILHGRPTFIHELQAEPWPKHNIPIKDDSLSDQNKTFNSKIFKAHVEFAKHTGARKIDLWGAPYWYYRKVKLHDPTIWQTARHIFKKPY